MKLSVIIAYYNAEEYIAELLDSLMDQGFSDNEYEIIVVDDGSTHDVSVLKNYGERYPNLHYVWQKNARQSAARNKGISMAKGEYIYICDNDDKVNRHVLDKICDIAHQNQLDILFFNRLLVNEDDVLPPPRNDFELRHEIVTGQQYVIQHPDISTGPWHYIVRRDFILQNHFQFPNGIIICEDVNFLIDICAKAQRVSYLNVDVYYWVQRSKSISHYEGKKKRTEKFISDMFWYIDQKRNMIKYDSNLSPKFIEWVNSNLNYHALRILHTAFRFLPYSKNKEYIGNLQNRGLYPVGEGVYMKVVPSFYYIRKVMNCKFVWLVLCVIFQCLPQKLRYKFY